MAACWKIVEKLLTFLLHMEKLMNQIACNDPFSTGNLLTEITTGRLFFCFSYTNAIYVLLLFIAVFVNYCIRVSN